jgi:hypothetical protein
VGILVPKLECHRDGDIQLLRLAPENVVGSIAQPPMVVWVRTDEDGLEVEIFDHLPHLAHGQIDILNRHRGDPVEPLRIGPAEIRHPVVIGAAGRGREARVFEVTVDQIEGRVEERDVDAFFVEYLDARVRIPTAGQDVLQAAARVRSGSR